MFAITYPQLMNQAVESGLSENDLVQLRKAYEFSESLFDGFYRGQGQPFINHLVRTASILLIEKADIQVLVAALVHAAYEIGQFRDGVEGKSTQAHRQAVRNGVGVLAEELIYAYQQLPWRSEDGIPLHKGNLSSYNNTLRTVVVIRLANELEDFLDLGMAYRRQFPYRTYIDNYGDQLIKMAQFLHFSQIENQLSLAFKRHLTVSIPLIAARPYKNCYEHSERIWQKKSTKEKVKTIIQKKIGLFTNKQSFFSHDDGKRKKISFYSERIFHQLDMSHDRELIEVVQNCLDLIKKQKQEIISTKFRPDPSAFSKVSETALKQIMGTGKDVDSIGTQRDITNCVVLNFKIRDSFLNDEVLELRRHVDKVVGRRMDEFFYNEDDLLTQNSGHFFYPPGGYMGWHTNSGSPGWRLYISYAEEPGKSFFRYRDPNTNEIVTSWDKEWNFRLFRIDQGKPFWHSVYSDTNRYSFGFRITLPQNLTLPKRMAQKIKNLVGV